MIKSINENTRFEISKLLGAPLDEFSIQELTEVYETDEDGMKRKSVGFFRDETIAKGFAQGQVDALYYKTEKVFVMVSERKKFGFLIGDLVELLSDEEAALEIRKKALAKLSPEERKILKL